ncbi:MAG: HdeD family acid-resistance protein [Lentimicrobiaceae bacterium]|nr:HdeD family acid-resistance protein [Lentimicrobiaceae bacterium]MBT3454317.1 HdeD family acid-resistance protein [Lentimicrobiaceae bacterium]MBT3817959.1 HdeD family acid-resistance protein [Lentimicrobiaceae bacterium]MBT4061535.1 HdeD family acid-resistance protein [Lentimicrobiaceae bacterium]MBT4466986.1 HdeD family acid-resistance protein [Lentimicrobiaceae bacterium]
MNLFKITYLSTTHKLKTMNNISYSKNWWALAFNGIIALLFGLLAIFAPRETLEVVIKYFGIVMLIVGVAMLFGAYSSMKNKLNYGTDLISAIITVALGVVLSFFTEKTLEVIVVVIGIWAIVLGIGQLIIMSALTSKPDKNYMLYCGLFTLVFGVLMFFNPFTMASVMTVVVGIMAVVIGVVLISFAFKLKNL